jgi:hypothetical protein
MAIEVAINGPRAAAKNGTDVWLDRVETVVESAFASLLGAERSPLLQFTGEIEAACRDSIRLDSMPHIVARLGALRKRLILLQLMFRQAAAFERGHRQWETESILGYTPRGLERSL